MEKVYLNLGEFQKATEVLEDGLLKAQKRIPMFLSDLALANYSSGSEDECSQLINELKEISGEENAGSPAFYLVVILRWNW